LDAWVRPSVSTRHLSEEWRAVDAIGPSMPTAGMHERLKTYTMVNPSLWRTFGHPLLLGAGVLPPRSGHFARTRHQSTDACVHASGTCMVSMHGECAWCACMVCIHGAHAWCSFMVRMHAVCVMAKTLHAVHAANVTGLRMRLPCKWTTSLEASSLHHFPTSIK